MNPSSSIIERHAPLIPVTECPQIIAHQANDVFAMWQAWEVECGAVCDVPYWAIVWPAARVLAQYLFAHPDLVKGKTVLDCGCGGGVAAIAAAINGAMKATACDQDPTAIAIGEHNAAANRVSIDFVCQDVIEYCQERRFDLILVADLFYQKDFSKRLISALRAANRMGSKVLIADSGRPFLPTIGLTELYSQSANTSFDVEGCSSRIVRLYQLVG